MTANLIYMYIEHPKIPSIFLALCHSLCIRHQNERRLDMYSHYSSNRICDAKSNEKSREMMLASTISVGAMFTCPHARSFFFSSLAPHVGREAAIIHGHRYVNVLYILSGTVCARLLPDQLCVHTRSL